MGLNLRERIGGRVRRFDESLKNKAMLHREREDTERMVYEHYKKEERLQAIKKQAKQDARREVSRSPPGRFGGGTLGKIGKAAAYLGKAGEMAQQYNAALGYDVSGTIFGSSSSKKQKQNTNSGGKRRRKSKKHRR